MLMANIYALIFQLKKYIMSNTGKCNATNELHKALFGEKEIKKFKVGDIVTLDGGDKQYEIAVVNADGTVRLKTDDIHHPFYDKSDGTIGCYHPLRIELENE